MVQKYMTNAYNKASIKASNSLKLDTKQADLKAIKMKKSKSIKKANVEIALKTPTPKKPTPNNPLYTSPNYMKSTSSSEARKTDTKSTIHNHKVAKTSSKSSNLKKMRALTKVPTFKHTKSTLTSCKKVVFDVQRATCSSTLKDSKLPEYLKLNSGTTEGEGNSVLKVCPYTYCSLNGHHHVSLPPLKRFISSRRKIMKRTLKFRPEVISPGKAKLNEDPNEVFFVEVFVSGRDVETQVSPSFSEIEFKDNYASNFVQKKLSFESDEESDGSLSMGLDDFVGENSDMDWEEVDSPDTYFQTDYSKDNEEKVGFELNGSESEKIEFEGHAFSQQFYDEIVECNLNFSDFDPSSDSESIHKGEKLSEDLIMINDHILSEEKQKIEHTYFPNEAIEILEDKSTNIHCTTFSDPIEEIKLNSHKNLDGINDNVGKKSAYSEENFDPSKVELHFEEKPHENGESNLKEKHFEIWNKLKRSIHERINVEREFNPRGPNFLPVEREEEPEKVNLRHQEIDERRSSDEWMVDYALQKTVNELGPARKRKVALLVEAFESVLPLPTR